MVSDGHITMRKKLVAGNWKMNGCQASNATLLQALLDASASNAGVDVAVFSPFPYLQQVQGALQGSSIAWGGQNVSDQVSGAFTGEVSVEMLKDFGAIMAIVGHSERRVLFGEGSELVAAKAAAAVSAGIIPVVCVGESLLEREAGQTLSVVRRQLAPVLERLGAGGVASAVIAYEPVWAIGTGRTATPAQAQEVHLALRGQVAEISASSAATVRVVYGGSVKASNARDLFALPDIDGALVGGASLVAAEFLAICRAAGC